jgi:hypothetical protein
VCNFLRLCQSAVDPRLMAISCGIVAGATEVEYGVCAKAAEAITRVIKCFMDGLEVKL